MWLDHLEAFTPFKVDCVFVFEIHNLKNLVLAYSLYLFCVFCNNHYLLLVYLYYHHLWIYIDAIHALIPNRIQFDYIRKGEAWHHIKKTCTI
jgi:hypothetical protein